MSDVRVKKKNSKLLFERIGFAYKCIAILLSFFVFLLDYNAYAQPINSVGNTFSFTQENVSVSNPTQTSLRDVVSSSIAFDLPEELGTVKESFQGNSPHTIFYIQDAHGQKSAQQSIFELIRFLQKHQDNALLFLEGGAPGEISRDLLRFFKKDSINDKITQKLFDEGKIGGPGLYLLKEEDSVPAYGVESLSLYQQNLLSFRRVYSWSHHSELFLKKLKHFVLSGSSRTLNTKLRHFVKKWLSYQSSHKDLMIYLKQLNQESRVSLKMDLSNARYQDRFPQLIRYYKLQDLDERIEKEQDLERLEYEKSQLLRWIQQSRIQDPVVEMMKLVVRVGSDIQAGELPKNIRHILELFYDEAKEHGFRWEQYPQLSTLFSKAVLSQELNGLDLFAEIQILTDRVFEKLAQSDQEKGLIEIFKDYFYIQQLFKLELTREEYLQVRSTIPFLTPGNFVKRIEHVTDTQFQSKVPFRNLERLFQECIRFYEDAIERETYMLQEVYRVLEETGKTKAVLVTGGFHSEGILETLKQHETSYFSITPQVKTLESKESYLDQMMLKKKWDPRLSRVIHSNPARLPIFRMALRDREFHVSELLRIVFDIVSNPRSEERGDGFDLQGFSLAGALPFIKRSEIRHPRDLGFEGEQLGLVMSLAERIKNRSGDAFDYGAFAKTAANNNDFDLMRQMAGFDMPLKKMKPHRTNTLGHPKQAMHEGVKNGLDWSVYDDGEDGEELRRLPTRLQSGEHGKSSLMFLGELKGKDDFAILDTKQKGGQGYRIYFWNDGVDYRIHYELVDLTFEHGTRLTVVAPVESPDAKAEDMVQRVRFNTVGPVDVNKTKANTIAPSTYDYLGPEGGDGIQPTSGVKVLIEQRGYRIVDYGVGMSLGQVLENYLLADEEAKEKRRQARKRLPEDTKLFTTKKTGHKTRVESFVSGNRIESFTNQDGDRLNLVEELALDFPPGTPYPSSVDTVDFDDAVIEGMKKIIRRLTVDDGDGNEEEVKVENIENRFARINALAVYIRQKQPEREHLGDQNLLEYLKTKTEEVIDYLEERKALGGILVPNDLHVEGTDHGWGAFEHEKFIPLDKDLFDFKFRYVLNELKELPTELKSDLLVENSPLQNVPIFTTSWAFPTPLASVATVILVHGQPMILLDGSIFEGEALSDEQIQFLLKELLLGLTPQVKELLDLHRLNRIETSEEEEGTEESVNRFTRLWRWVGNLSGIQKILLMVSGLILFFAIVFASMDFNASTTTTAPVGPPTAGVSAVDNVGEIRDENSPPLIKEVEKKDSTDKGDEGEAPIPDKEKTENLENPETEKKEAVPDTTPLKPDKSDWYEGAVDPAASPEEQLNQAREGLSLEKQYDFLLQKLREYWQGRLKNMREGDLQGKSDGAKKLQEGFNVWHKAFRDLIKNNEDNPLTKKAQGEHDRIFKEFDESFADAWRAGVKHNAAKGRLMEKNSFEAEMKKMKEHGQKAIEEARSDNPDMRNIEKHEQAVARIAENMKHRIQRWEDSNDEEARKKSEGQSQKIQFKVQLGQSEKDLKWARVHAENKLKREGQPETPSEETGVATDTAESDSSRPRFEAPEWLENGAEAIAGFFRSIPGWVWNVLLVLGVGFMLILASKLMAGLAGLIGESNSPLDEDPTHQGMNQMLDTTMGDIFKSLFKWKSESYGEVENPTKVVDGWLVAQINPRLGREGRWKPESGVEKRVKEGRSKKREEPAVVRIRGSVQEDQRAQLLNYPEGIIRDVVVREKIGRKWVEVPQSDWQRDGEQIVFDRDIAEVEIETTIDIYDIGDLDFGIEDYEIPKEEKDDFDDLLKKMVERGSQEAAALLAMGADESTQDYNDEEKLKAVNAFLKRFARYNALADDENGFIHDEDTWAASAAVRILSGRKLECVCQQTALLTYLLSKYVGLNAMYIRVKAPNVRGKFVTNKVGHAATLVSIRDSEGEARWRYVETTANVSLSTSGAFNALNPIRQKIINSIGNSLRGGETQEGWNFAKKWKAFWKGVGSILYVFFSFLFQGVKWLLPIAAAAGVLFYIYQNELLTGKQFKGFFIITATVTAAFYGLAIIFKIYFAEHRERLQKEFDSAQKTPKLTGHLSPFHHTMMPDSFEDGELKFSPNSSQMPVETYGTIQEGRSDGTLARGYYALDGESGWTQVKSAKMVSKSGAQPIAEKRATFRFTGKVKVGQEISLMLPRGGGANLTGVIRKIAVGDKNTEEVNESGGTYLKKVAFTQIGETVKIEQGRGSDYSMFEDYETKTIVIQYEVEYYEEKDTGIHHAEERVSSRMPAAERAVIHEQLRTFLGDIPEGSAEKVQAVRNFMRAHALISYDHTQEETFIRSPHWNRLTSEEPFVSQVARVLSKGQKITASPETLIYLQALLLNYMGLPVMRSSHISNYGEVARTGKIKTTHDDIPALYVRVTDEEGRAYIMTEYFSPHDRYLQKTITNRDVLRDAWQRFKAWVGGLAESKVLKFLVLGIYYLSLVGVVIWLAKVIYITLSAYLYYRFVDLPKVRKVFFNLGVPQDSQQRNVRRIMEKIAFDAYWFNLIQRLKPAGAREHVNVDGEWVDEKLEFFILDQALEGENQELLRNAYQFHQRQGVDGEVAFLQGLIRVWEPQAQRALAHAWWGSRPREEEGREGEILGSSIDLPDLTVLSLQGSDHYRNLSWPDTIPVPASSLFFTDEFDINSSEQVENEDQDQDEYELDPERRPVVYHYTDGRLQSGWDNTFRLGVPLETFSPLHQYTYHPLPFTAEATEIGEFILDWALKDSAQSQERMAMLQPLFRLVSDIHATHEAFAHNVRATGPVIKDLEALQGLVERVFRLAKIEIDRTGNLDDIHLLRDYLDEYVHLGGQKRLDILIYHVAGQDVFGGMSEENFPFPQHTLAAYLSGKPVLKKEPDENFDLGVSERLLTPEVESRFEATGGKPNLAWLVEASEHLEESGASDITLEETRDAMLEVSQEKAKANLEGYIQDVIRNQDKKRMVLLREIIQNARDVVRRMQSSLRKSGLPDEEIERRIQEELKKFKGLAEVRARSYLRDNAETGGEDWIFSVEDPIGMTLDTEVFKYFPPDATTKSPTDMIQETLERNLSADKKLTLILNDLIKPEFQNDGEFLEQLEAVIEESHTVSTKPEFNQLAKKILGVINRQGEKLLSLGEIKTKEDIFAEALSAGFFGIGNYTIYADADEVTLRTGRNGKVHFIRLKVEKDEFGNVVAVVIVEMNEYQDPEERFKGTLIQRVKHVNPEQRVQIELEANHLKYLFQKYVGAVSDVFLKFADVNGDDQGFPVMDKRDEVAKHGNVTVLTSEQKIGRVTVDELYIQDPGDEELFARVPDWIKGWIKRNHINFEFKKGTQVHPARTALLEPEEHTAEVAVASIKAALVAYVRGEVSVPGLPRYGDFMRDPALFNMLEDLPLDDEQIQDDAALMSQGKTPQDASRWDAYLADEKRFLALMLLIDFPRESGESLSLYTEKRQLFFSQVPGSIAMFHVENLAFQDRFSQQDFSELPETSDPVAYGNFIAGRMVQTLLSLYVEGEEGIRLPGYIGNLEEYLLPETPFVGERIDESVRDDLALFEDGKIDAIDFSYYQSNSNGLRQLLFNLRLEGGQSINRFKKNRVRASEEESSEEESSNHLGNVVRLQVNQEGTPDIVNTFDRFLNAIGEILENHVGENQQRSFRQRVEWSFSGADREVLSVFIQFLRGESEGHRLFPMILNRMARTTTGNTSVPFYSALLIRSGAFAEFRESGIDPQGLSESLSTLDDFISMHQEANREVRYAFQRSENRSVVSEPRVTANMVLSITEASLDARTAVAELSLKIVGLGERSEARLTMLETFWPVIGPNPALQNIRTSRLQAAIEDSVENITAVIVTPGDLQGVDLDHFIDSLFVSLRQKELTHEAIITVDSSTRGAFDTFKGNFDRRFIERAQEWGYANPRDLLRKVQRVSLQDFNAIGSVLIGIDQKVVVVAPSTSSINVEGLGQSQKRIVTDRLPTGLTLGLTRGQYRNVLGSFVTGAFEMELLQGEQISEESYFLVQGEDERWYARSRDALDQLSTFITQSIQYDMALAQSA